MLQVDVCHYASDALEDAMRLAQTKSLNSYTFSDCLSFLNYVWSDIYSQICTIDSGYYSKVVKLSSKLTKLPKFVKNSIMVYSAQRPTGFDRRIYRMAGESNLNEPGTYRISGNDLWCPDAEHRSVWLEYCPQPAQIFFTHHNRDPKLYTEDVTVERNNVYNVYLLVAYDSENNEVDYTDPEVTLDNVVKWAFRHRNTALEMPEEDITNNLVIQPDADGTWVLKYVSCDYPYIFCSYENQVTGEWKSGFFDKSLEWTDFNPFAWTGRNDSIEYVKCKYNDKTGLGVIIKDHNDTDERITDITDIPYEVDATDHVSVIYVESPFEFKGTNGSVTKFTEGYWYNRRNTNYDYEKVLNVEPADPDLYDVWQDNGQLKVRTDNNQWELVTQNVKTFGRKVSGPRVKELGWTPDTKLVYPAPEVYRYLVTRLAEKFASLNESNIMGVQSELVDARFAFQAFLKKDKSAWERMRNVNPATIGDWL